MRKDIQAALRDKLCCQRDFPRFGVWLLQDFGAPVRQKRHRQRTFCVEIVLVDAGRASVDDGFLAAGQQAGAHLLFQDTCNQLGFHRNRVFTIFIAVLQIQRVDMMLAVRGDFNDFAAQRPRNGRVLTLGVNDDNVIVGRQSDVCDGILHGNRLTRTGHTEIKRMGRD